jgi:hypothetical protein
MLNFSQRDSSFYNRNKYAMVPYAGLPYGGGAGQQFYDTYESRPQHYNSLQPVRRGSWPERAIGYYDEYDECKSTPIALICIF